jgi:tight adherence protein C
MIEMALIGAAIGAIVFWMVLRLVPRRDSPLVQLAKLDAMFATDSWMRTETVHSVEHVGGREGAETRLGGWVTALLTKRGYSYTSLRQDLALTGKTVEAVMGRKVVGFAIGFVLAVAAVVAVTVVGGVTVPPGIPVVAAFGVGIGFFFLPDMDARSVAAKRRKDFEFAFAAFQLWVALEMAGSAAPEEALPSVAQVGSGWPLALLRDTLYRARLAKGSAWDALAELGVRIGVDDLRDLGQLVKLVAQDGAKVRETLTARSTTMRRRQLAVEQGVAGERDQSMRLAQIVLGLGFIIFLGYPAVAAIAGL